MLLTHFVHANADHCRNRVESLDQKIQQGPDGIIRCYKNHKGYITKIYYKDKPREYLPKGQLQQAKDLALKTFYVAQYQDCMAELDACEKYLEATKRFPHAVEHLMENEGIRDLLSDQMQVILPPTQAEFKKWMEEPYDRNPKYAEYLKFVSDSGVKVRSKSELLCIQILESLGIPYRYEQLQIIGGTRFYPDFTVRRPRDGAFFLIELFGMMDEPGYAAKTYEKLNVYSRNGWVQDENLICFYESKRAPLDLRLLRERLTYFLLKP